jgi:hypothetical protein
MSISIQSMLVRTCCCVLALAGAACSSKRDAPMTVADLMDDRVTLDGVLMKCNQDPAAGNDASCINARVAGERLAGQNEAAKQAKRAEEFERNREKLRVAEEQRRADEEARKVDAYHLPVVPVEPPPAAMASDNSTPH